MQNIFFSSLISKSLTFLSSGGNVFHLLANCLVSSCFEGSASLDFCSIPSRSITIGRCSWQNWKNGFAGRLGAFGSRSAFSVLLPVLRLVPELAAAFFLPPLSAELTDWGSNTVAKLWHLWCGPHSNKIWLMETYSLVVDYLCFRGLCCLHLQGRWKVHFYQTTLKVYLAWLGKRMCLQQFCLYIELWHGTEF